MPRGSSPCPEGCICGRHKTKGTGASRTTTKDGYIVISRPEHPLAGKQGLVLEHRQVLYDKIGPGPHACHWIGVNSCGATALTWKEIHVDHVDEDRGNNDPENLVPSCRRCNMHRNKAVLLGPRDVLDIRKLYEAGRLSQEAIAVLFGVSGATVCRLLNDRLGWSVIEGGDANEKTA